MRFKFLPIVLTVFCLVSAFFWKISPSYVFAQSNTKGGLTLSPAFEEVVMGESDKEKVVSIQIQNKDNGDVTLELFPINFRQTDEYGKIGFQGQESKEYSFALSSFIRLDDSTYTLKKGEKITIPVTIENRKDLAPGGHYAAIVARVIQETEKTTISPAISSLILLRKAGGEIFNVSVKDVDWPRGMVDFGYKDQYSILFQNEGNVHLTPFGEVLVEDIMGRTLYTGVVNTSSLKIFPLSRRYIPVKMQKVSWSLPLSINKITIQGHDSLNKVTYVHKDTFIYIHPLFLGLLCLVIITRVAGSKKLSKYASIMRKNERLGQKPDK